MTNSSYSELIITSKLKSEFKISLLENGIHSFNKGLDELISYEKEGKNDDFKLKESIMFLHHGIELLLKQVLIKFRGEYLIFENISNETIKKIIEAKNKGISVFNLRKPIHTASYLDVIQRIKAFIDEVELIESLETRLIELNSIRNNIEHYGIDTEKEKVENLLLKLNKPISIFFETAGLKIGNDNEAKWKELEKQLLIEASRLRGGECIKKAELDSGFAIIEYVRNFEEYKKLQPQSMVTEEKLDLYWKTGDAILKAIIDGGVRLMRKLDFLEGVKIILPFKNTSYTIDLKKSEVEDFLGFSFEEIKENWDEIFSDKYVYNEQGRQAFYDMFGKTEKVN